MAGSRLLRGWQGAVSRPAGCSPAWARTPHCTTVKTPGTDQREAAGRMSERPEARLVTDSALCSLRSTFGKKKMNSSRLGEATIPGSLHSGLRNTRAVPRREGIILTSGESKQKG